MGEYGDFKVFPISLDRYAIYVEYKGSHLYADYDPGGYNPDGKFIRNTTTGDKAIRLCQKYEQKMGRFN